MNNEKYLEETLNKVLLYYGKRGESLKSDFMNFSV